MTMRGYKACIDGYEMQKKRDLMSRDYENWLLGMYIQASIASVLDSKNKYPEKPFLIDSKNKDLDHMTEEELNEEIMKCIQKEQQWIVNDAIRGLPPTII